jgi:hypothetical protein
MNRCTLNLIDRLVTILQSDAGMLTVKVINLIQSFAGENRYLITLGGSTYLFDKHNGDLWLMEVNAVSMPRIYESISVYFEKVISAGYGNTMSLYAAGTCVGNFRQCFSSVVPWLFTMNIIPGSTYRAETCSFQFNGSLPSDVISNFNQYGPAPWSFEHAN